MRFDITAIGELLIDFAQLEADSEGYPLMKANPGGAPCNFLAAAGSRGLKTAFIGKVGDDAFGRMLAATLDKAGVCAEGLIFEKNAFTTLAFVTTDAAGDRSFSFARKPGADSMLTADEIDTKLIDDSRALHFGSLSLTDEPSRSAVKQAVLYAKEKGKLITCDPNLRPPLWSDMRCAREQIKWCLEQADIVKMSVEETEFIFGKCTPETAAKRLCDDFGVKLAMVTMGSEGCHMRSGTAAVSVPCPNAHAIDTTGAGDIFGGTAIAGILMIGTQPELLDEDALLAVGRYAQCAASMSTEKRGGISSVPSAKDVAERMKREFE